MAPVSKRSERKKDKTVTVQSLVGSSPSTYYMPQPLFFRALAALPKSLIVSKATPLVLAQMPSDVKDRFGYGLGFIFMVGFIWGVICIWTGADKIKRGDNEGKAGIVSGLIIAGAATIMGAFFAIFGLSDGALTPKF